MKRKSLVATALILLFGASIVQAEPKFIEKTRDFMKKKKACVLAVGVYIDNPESNALDSAPFVKCIADMTLYAGTINEKSGCSFTTYYPGTDQYKKVKPKFEMAIGKPCDQGGFEILLKMMPDAICGSKTATATVADCLVYRPTADARYAFYYAESSKYEDWFKAATEKKVGK